MFCRVYVQQHCTTIKKAYIKLKMHMIIQNVGGDKWYLKVLRFVKIPDMIKGRKQQFYNQIWRFLNYSLSN